LLALAFLSQLGNPFYHVYSLELTGIDGVGDPAGLSALAFNVTLHVRNNWWLLPVENRFSHGQVVVSYDGVAIGDARLPGFTAGARSTAEVKAVARAGRAGMVETPGGLVGRRVEAELRWGSAEFDVEAKLFRDGQGAEERAQPWGWESSSGPVVLWCKVGSQVSQQPSRCKVFTNFRTGSSV
jgi:hypothetical protein